MSGALIFAGASLCATSYYLPRAYNALLGGALVFFVMRFANKWLLNIFLRKQGLSFMQILSEEGFI